MENDRISYFHHHTLVVEKLIDNHTLSEEKHFTSKHEMMKWMRDHENDGYNRFWAQSVEVEDIQWVSQDGYRKMAEGYMEIARARGIIQ